MAPMDAREAALLGFHLEGGGAHSARTIMLPELTDLLASVTDANASQEDYRRAVEEENCLAKRSRTTRSLTYRHLAHLYSLDHHVLLLRALRFFWSREAAGQPLLALLCAFARDPLLRASAPPITGTLHGDRLGRREMQAHLEKCFGSRFSTATLTSTAQNVLSSWTKSGHLSGVRTKRRSQADATPAAVSYALLLGYLNGQRGRSLFETEYARLLDRPVPVAMELAAEASRRGWLVFKRIDDIVEVLFPRLIPEREKERLREQA